ncbi:MAG: ABC transporter ATP-binding protein [Caldilineaceae bacterium]|nr:ABC transporter ATP-binding protein [Caldilineaceae bacterium]
MNARTRKFFSYYKPYLGLFAADMTCAFLVSAITLVLPLCIRFITKNVLGGDISDALPQIYGMGAVMVALIAVHTVANIFVDYQGHLMGARMESDMRQELFAHYQKLSFRFYDEQKTGQLMTRLTNDSFDMSELYHHGPEDVVISLLSFIGAFVVLVNINASLTVIVMLFLPVMVVFSVYFNRRMKRALRLSKDRIGDINAQVEDTLAGIRTVKSFTNEAVEQAKFAFENQRFVDSRGAGYQSEAYFYSGLIAFTNLMTTAVVVFGGVAIVNASLDLADLITFLLYIGILIEPIKRFANFTRLYQEGMAGFERFMEVLEIEPDVQDAPNAREISHVDGHIEFKDVSFRYRDEYTDVLKEVSLTVGAGEYVALVGASGVGKTTLCALIPRFYEANAGEILIDGVPIRAMTQRSLRRHIGVVQQDVYLFSGTVEDNIRYGQPSAGDDEIVAAAKRANAHDFIMALPHGYATDIGERGVKLSGGQKQRLSIARVFLKDPPILIFDEATSALDNESERAVRQSLEQLTQSRTTLVIAHRLSTIRNAQRIVVLDGGRIAEIGTHDELITRNGAYAHLYNMQLTL